MLFKGDAYIKVQTNNELLDFSTIDKDKARRLALDFNVKQTIESEPNDGEISIYNLSESSRNKISQNGLKIEVYAGYEDIKLIGKGAIKNVNNLKNGVDWQTTITFGDGQKEFTEAKISKSYKKGVEKKTIIADTIKEMGLPVNDLSAIEGKLNGALVIDGLCKDVLDEQTKDLGLDWSIQNEEIIITKKGKANDLVEAIVVKAETGLLEHPNITERGVDFKMQLHPDIKPKTVVKLEPISAAISAGGDELSEQRNKSAEGVFVCESVEFSGNNYGGAFDVAVSARRYNQ